MTDAPPSPVTCTNSNSDAAGRKPCPKALQDHLGIPLSEATFEVALDSLFWKLVEEYGTPNQGILEHFNVIGTRYVTAIRELNEALDANVR